MILLLNENRSVISVQRERVDGVDDFSFLKGFDFVSVVAEADREIATNFITEVTECASAAPCTLRLNLSPGNSPEFHCNGQRVDGNKLSVVARKKQTADAVNDQLASASQKIRVLFEKTPVAMLIVDTAGDIEAVNPIAVKLFGYEADEWSRMKLLNLLHPDSSKGVATDLTMSFVVSQCGSMCRLTGRHKSGAGFPLELFAEQLDESGSTLLLSIFDITQRVELEQQKREFVQMVSHDLRTPLTNLSIFLETILMGLYRTRPPESLEDSARTLNDDVSRLIRLITKLLTIDKIEHGFSQPKIRKTSLVDLVDAAIVSTGTLALARDVSLDTAIADIDVGVDKDQIVQVLVNFIGNAIKFSTAGGKITIQAEQTEEYLEVRVCDEGPGIPKELQEKIFDRFSQVDGLKQTRAGTGLGLTICKALVAGHGGTVGVDSTEGKGSVFWFRIPK